MQQSAAPVGGELVYRHRLPTRLWHWTNALTIFVMVMSGLMIFNAHPHLYWGQYGANFEHPWLDIGGDGTRGWLRVGSHELNTTGWLGQSSYSDGSVNNHAFPSWATIPSHYNLAKARNWHLFFAWVLVLPWALFVLISLFNRHLRQLLPTRDELRPSHILHDILDHARLRFPTGAAALNFNILQKASYLAVLFGLIPLMVLTGLAMSPGWLPSWPWLGTLFGGRASARSIHFIVMSLIVAFVIVHLIMVVLAGPFNEVRSMITGRFRLPIDKRAAAAARERAMQAPMAEAAPEPMSKEVAP